MAKTILSSSSYTYSPASQQVDFTNFTASTGAVFDFTRLLAIIDVTQGQIIYSTAGHTSGLDGTYSAPTLTLAFNTTGFPGGDLQIIYDLASAPNATYDGTGTQPILSTTDSITGREGLDINLLNSSFGGQLGWPLPSSTTSGFNDALSVGFINGGNLVAPTMDAMTNNLLVDINSVPTTSTLPVTISGTSIIQPVDMTYVAGNPVSTSNPLPTGLASSSGSVIDYNQGASTNNTIRVAANQFTSSGVGLDYGAGNVTSATQRTMAPDYTTTGPSAAFGVGSNILQGGTSSLVVDGHKFALIQINSAGVTGSYIFEGSNDNVNFFNIAVYNSLNPNALPILGAITPINGAVMYSVPLSARWLRVRCVSAIGSNIQCIARYSQTIPPLLFNTGASQYNAASNPSVDVLNTPIVTSKYNQIEIDFNTAPSSSVLTTTTAGGGTFTQANGHSLFTTGTATTSSAKAVTVASIQYRPANEIYTYFSASFTTPTSGNSYQRIGIYDVNNGFFIGYSGTNFGVAKRTATVDTFTVRSSWNGDPLDGSSSSKFTRNGTPEAINLTLSNLFRIRFAWLGSANILFDVFSPDGVWVNFHSIKQPNSSLNPSLTVPNVPITLDVAKASADATSLVMSTACWAGGTTSPYAPITATLTDNTLATLGRSVITGVTTGGGGGYVNVKVNPSGSLVTDATVSSSVLPTGGSTSALQISGNTSLSSIDTKTPALGQALAAASTPVVLTAAQITTLTPLSTVASTQSGTWNINNISGTVSLPTGAATETTLAAINTKTPALGQTTMANSTPVVFASDMSILTTSASDLYITGQAAQTAIINNIIPATASVSATDAANYKSGVIQINSTGTAGSYILETSNDNSNFVPLLCYNIALNTGIAVNGAVTATASSIGYSFSVQSRYIRVRIVGAITGGSIQAFTRLSQAAWTPAVTSVGQATGSILNTNITSGTVTTVSTVTAVTTVGTVSAVTSAALANISTTDITNAAITTTTTGTAVPMLNVQAVSFGIFVTAVSGTSPTLDAVIQYSYDAVNYFDAYHFERITATGAYYSPQMIIAGSHYRIVRTVAGTTPSFTMTMNRTSKQTTYADCRRVFDRTINPNSAGSTSPAMLVDGFDEIQLTVSMASGGTVPPIFGLQASEDNVNWCNFQSSVVTITGSPSTTACAAGTVGYLPKYIRAYVSSAGTGAAINWVAIKARG